MTFFVLIIKYKVFMADKIVNVKYVHICIMTIHKSVYGRLSLINFMYIILEFWKNYYIH